MWQRHNSSYCIWNLFYLNLTKFIIYLQRNRIKKIVEIRNKCLNSWKARKKTLGNVKFLSNKICWSNGAKFKLVTLFYKFMIKENLKSCLNKLNLTPVLLQRNFLIPISLQPDGINLWYFKLKLLYLTKFIVWNIIGLQNVFAKI